MPENRLAKALENQVIECQACRFFCHLKPGQTGNCGVRQNVGGKLKLLVDGRPIALHIDPIEKKPLYHFLPGSQILSIGTVGCNFGCSFCQNWDISQVTRLGPNIKHFQGLELNFDQIGDVLTAHQAVDLCLKHHLPSLAFTYNEPTIFTEYAIKIMKLARKYDIKGVYVSNGYMTETTLDALDGCIDAYNIDLKAFSDAFYAKFCKARLQPVLDSIMSIYQRGKWLELTTLIIPGENDASEELRQAAMFIAALSPDIPWHLSAFHPDFEVQDKARTPLKTLQMAYDIARHAGLRYVYLGNVRAPQGNSTYCPNCQAVLINRDAGDLSCFIHENVCSGCQTIIPGIWS